MTGREWQCQGKAGSGMLQDLWAKIRISTAKGISEIINHFRSLLKSWVECIPGISTAQGSRRWSVVKGKRKQFKLLVCGVSLKLTVESQESNEVSLPTRHLFSEKWWPEKQTKCSFALRKRLRKAENYSLSLIWSDTTPWILCSASLSSLTGGESRNKTGLGKAMKMIKWIESWSVWKD